MHMLGRIQKVKQTAMDDAIIISTTTSVLIKLGASRLFLIAIIDLNGSLWSLVSLVGMNDLIGFFTQTQMFAGQHVILNMSLTFNDNHIIPTKHGIVNHI